MEVRHVRRREDECTVRWWRRRKPRDKQLRIGIEWILRFVVALIFPPFTNFTFGLALL